MWENRADRGELETQRERMREGGRQRQWREKRWCGLI